MSCGSAGSSESIADVKKELQNVKTRAVSKIRALQGQVDTLTKQVEALESKQVARHDSDTSAASDTSEGFTKVDRASDADLRAREAALQQREDALRMRETALQERLSWHGALLQGLASVQSNLQQVELAADVAL